MFFETKASSKEIEAKDKASKFLNQLLPYGESLKPVDSLQFKDDPEKIYSLLELSNKFKLGRHPSGDFRLKNIEVVRKSIQNKVSIPIVVTIGTSKWYDGSHQEENVANLSELLMFEQLTYLNERVKYVYKPGLQIFLLAEDLTNQWLYGLVFPRVNIASNNMSYLSSMNLFASILQKTRGLNLKFLSEQELLQQKNLDFSRYKMICDNNKIAFNMLFNKSKTLENKYLAEHGFVSWTDETWSNFVTDVLSKTEEYLKLNKIGWRGAIHPDVRNFYLRQFNKSAQQTAREEAYLAAYFGGVLARKQIGTLNLATDNQNFIKLAFLKYPKGSQVDSINAIQVSQHPLAGFGSSHQHISPWASLTRVAVDDKGECSLQVVPAKNEEILPSKDITKLQFSYFGLNIPVDVVRV